MELSFIPLIIGSQALSYHLGKLDIKHNLCPLDSDFIVPNREAAYEYVEYIRQFYPEIKIQTIISQKKFSCETLVLSDFGMMWELTYPLNKKCTTYKLYHDFEHVRIEPPAMLESTKYATYNYASLDMLYTLKMSHRYLRNSPHFHKTMLHIKNMRKVGAKIIDEKFYQARMKETYNYPLPKLNVGKKDFFTSNFDYIYDHDSIHEAVKMMPDRPAYTYYMTSDAEVMCSKDKFFEQPKAIQLLGVLEESYVLALERSQIPNEFMVAPKRSFELALEKVCTSITSGWFREFAWENYDLVMMLYSDDYIKKFTDAMRNGVIKPYTSGEMK